MKRPLSTLGLLVALLSVPASAWAAPPEPADVLRLSSAAANQINATDPDPDEAFFSVKGAPPTIAFILDTSGSMNSLVVRSDSLWRPSEGTCSNPTYDGVIAAGGFSMAKSYPAPDLGDGGDDAGFPNLFQQNRYYYKRGTGTSAVNGLGRTGVSSSNTLDTSVKACEQVSWWYRGTCSACVAAKGYYLGWDGSTKVSVFSGKFLNFYPPRFVTARKVLKDVIRNTERARISLAKFDGNNGARFLRKAAPQCTASLNPDSEQWAEGRKKLIEEVNDVSFSGNTPLAEALFDVASSFVQGSQLASWFGSSSRRNSTLYPADVNSEDRPICFGCQVSAVILISDGEPTQDGDVPKKVRDLNVTCSGSGCNNQYLDDVAAFFYQNDIQPELAEGSGWDATGTQRIATYTIGFGISLPLMESAAAVGGGTYQEANDGTSLATAITTIINDINKRSTTAGSTSIASLQAGSETTTLVPRFRPGNEIDPWKGFLYRFGLANELTNGCVASGDASDPGANDVDKDGACNSIAYVDSDGFVVVEDPVSGDFVRAIDGNPAKPYWEAGTQLVQSGLPVHDSSRAPDNTAAKRRNLWTAVPGEDGAMQTVRFHPDNAAQLMHAMGLQADVRGDPTCRQIATTMGIASDLETLLETWGQTCASIIIRHFRGEFSTHPDPDKRNKPREWLLADIFHSSPIVVEPPVLPESCANFPSQCLASLWVDEGSFAKTEPREAYREFVTGSFCGAGNSCEERRTVALVGSNGGFLHAFDMGVTDPEGERDLLTGRLPLENHGTGTELWGFMPPDLLGTLKDGMRGHTFMVDGTAMVREVWVDGAGGGAADGKKQAGEFRTVAVVGTGSGGSHFFALDLTESLNLPASHEDLVNSGSEPRFLWMWPEPGSPRVADMGQTFSNFYPRPPPIGPVLLEASDGFEFRFQDVLSGSSDAWQETTVKAEERWIVGLNGGKDPTQQRGRGFALVDVWTGQAVWEQFWSPSATDARKDMLHPIPAGLALMDIGSGQLTTEAPFDGYFDTLTVGDTGGNLWVARMHRPGKLGAGGTVENWYVGRGFQTERDASTVNARRPITNLTSNALQRTTGYMRTFFGTGDRGALLDPTTGKCSLSNLQACVTMGCNVRVDEWRDQLPVNTHRRTYWNDGAVSSALETASAACVSADCAQPKVQACLNGCTETTCNTSSGYSLAAGRAACIALARASCGTACDGTPKNNMGLLTVVSVSECAPDAGHAPMVRAIDSSCGEREVTVMIPDPDGGEDATQPLTYTTRSCGSTVLRNDAAFEVTYLASDTGADVKHRFVGAHVYGGTPERAFATASGAASFDAARHSESDLTFLGTRGGTSTTEADPLGAGWYLDYEHVHERTASPAGMAASLTGDSLCVVWNSLVPGEESAVCGGAGEQQAHMIQADFATGSATCLQDFTPGQRSVARAVISAPPEPTPATVIGAGSVASGFMTTEPGQSPRFIRGFTNADPLQPIYQLELTNQEHQCRHTAAAAACGI